MDASGWVEEAAESELEDEQMEASSLLFEEDAMVDRRRRSC